MVRLRLALLVFLCYGLAQLASAATIILVRHAERANMMSADSLLSRTGEERARQLANVLKDAKIGRIFVTDVRRTQQTAEPIATRLHLTPLVLAKGDVDGLVSQLRKTGDDETVLVVGHADTVPMLVERLGGGPVPAIEDDEYDRMIVLVFEPGRKTQTLTLRYGNAAP
jgi:broad specificity phosphatase PhoE